MSKHPHDSATIPNGEHVLVEGVGMTALTKYLKLENILCIPSFKTYLLSVSQLTKGLNCTMMFFHDFYVIQDLVLKRVIGTCECKDGL